MPFSHYRGAVEDVVGDRASDCDRGEQAETETVSTRTLYVSYRTLRHIETFDDDQEMTKASGLMLIEAVSIAWNRR